MIIKMEMLVQNAKHLRFLHSCLFLTILLKEEGK